MNCRIAVLSDVNAVVDIHIQSFSKFFLSSLGKKFLATFYRSIVKFPEAISVVIISKHGKILGFAVGSVKSSGFYKRLVLRYPLSFTLQAVILCISKPGAIVHLLRNFSKKEDNIESNCSELLSIAVSPEDAGTGSGKLLIRAFEAIAKDKGAHSVSLTTDAENNENVISFYKKNGYSILYEFQSYPDRHMYRMIKNLN